MIPKTISPNEQFRNTPVTTFLKVGSQGVDKDQLQKIAAGDQFVFDAVFEKKANKSYLHVITTGDWKTYGANNNGDAWPIGPVHMTAADGHKSLTTGGGLNEHHGREVERRVEIREIDRHTIGRQRLGSERFHNRP